MANLLLIEPDAILSSTLKKSFEGLGHKVKVCRSGQTALDAVDTSPPDVIVLELQLGLHNGIEFLYELRSYDDWSHIPVVVHTANRTALAEKFKTQWRLLGVSKVIYKPQAKLEQLVSAVENQLVKA